MSGVASFARLSLPLWQRSSADDSVSGGVAYGIPGGPPSEAIKAEKLSPAAVGNEFSPSFCASGWVPTPEPHPISIPDDQPGIR